MRYSRCLALGRGSRRARAPRPCATEKPAALLSCSARCIASRCCRSWPRYASGLRIHCVVAASRVHMMRVVARARLGVATIFGVDGLPSFRFVQPAPSAVRRHRHATASSGSSWPGRRKRKGPKAQRHSKRKAQEHATRTKAHATCIGHKAPGWAAAAVRSPGLVGVVAHATGIPANGRAHGGGGASHAVRSRRIARDAAAVRHCRHEQGAERCARDRGPCPARMLVARQAEVRKQTAHVSRVGAVGGRMQQRSSRVKVARACIRVAGLRTA